MSTDNIVVDDDDATNSAFRSHLNNLKVQCGLIKHQICTDVNTENIDNVFPSDIKDCSKLTKSIIAEQLLSLLKLSDVMCQCDLICKCVNPSDISVNNNYQICNNDQLSVPMSDAISDVVLKAVEKSLKQYNTDIEQKFSDLTNIVTSLNNFSSVSGDEQQPTTLKNASNSANISPPEPCVYRTFNDFIDENETSKLSEFLSKVEYHAEKGHSVKNFGVNYNYTGAGDGRSGDCEIPSQIQTIIEKINSDYTKANINQCLVNRYIGGSSQLSPHSDDEPIINPDSLIFCLSIGQERSLIFRDKFSGTETTHIAMDKSMYVMTRSSQAYYTHQIKPEILSDSVTRYSLVFRHVDKSFKNSAVIIGDSNTKGFKFGEGKGNFGKSLPGKRIQAAQVDDINPFDCAAYANVVIVVGTNNLRRGLVSNTSDVDKIVQSLAEKVKVISTIRKDIKIKLMPVLPTRYAEMNRHIMYFNREVYKKFILSGVNFNIAMPSVEEFLDGNVLLRNELAKPGDAIHLNDRGLSIFAKCIKHSILPYVSRAVNSDRKSSQGSSQGRDRRPRTPS